MCDPVLHRFRLFAMVIIEHEHANYMKLVVALRALDMPKYATGAYAVKVVRVEPGIFLLLCYVHNGKASKMWSLCSKRIHERNLLFPAQIATVQHPQFMQQPRSTAGLLSF
jgi:hypothetical protein